jgi:hypothetical protein
LDNCRNAIEVRKTRKVSDAPVVPVVPEHTFEQVAREWHARNLLKWTSGHAVTIMSRLQRDCFCSVRSEGDTPARPRGRRIVRRPHLAHQALDPCRVAAPHRQRRDTFQLPDEALQKQKMNNLPIALAAKHVII